MLTLVIAAAVSHGVFLTGNDLYSRCQERDQTTCLAYVLGVADTISAFENENMLPSKICTSQFVSPTQQRDVVIAYLRDHPENRDKEAAALAIMALKTAFPC